MNTARTVLLTPRDPLIFRDGRPFDSSLSSYIHIYRWPPPSVTAGALRTAVGRQSGDSFDSERARQLDIAGPLPLAQTPEGEQLYVPAPLDCHMRKTGVDTETGRDSYTGYALSPVKPGDDEGTDLPPGLLPLLPQSGDAGPLPKPSQDIVWWPRSLMVEWLCRIPDFPWENRFDTCWNVLPQEERTHVRINPETGAAEDGKLFTTRAIDFRRHGEPQPIQLALRIDKYSDAPSSEREALEGMFLPLGAERRGVVLSLRGDDSLWRCPDGIAEALNKKPCHIRMVLATPAIFKAGWRPEWLDKHSLQGKIPGTEVEVRLIAAAIDRYQAVSGWSYLQGAQAQKAAKKMVPAGSVYFFEILGGNPAELAERWLRPVCGKSVLERDSKLGADGFGLALWGVARQVI